MTNRHYSIKTATKEKRSFTGNWRGYYNDKG